MKRFVFVLALLVAPIAASAQQASPAPEARAREIQELRGELARISARLDTLEKEEANASSVPAPSPAAAPAPSPVIAVAPPPVSQPEAARTLGLLRSVNFGFTVDGYYGYNFNEPVGRVNLLRAYDVSSNSFSINQADIIVEKRPTPESRAGGRVDLMWGQATETLQGNPLNEQRPQVWRNLFQAYGSYLAPVGSGLQLDFGKFASVLGAEGNYTKDQTEYSRAYTFIYLPFYHTGLRATYNFTPKVSLMYWLVNGAQQTEDFNSFKSQAFLWTLQPASSFTWNLNYYFGQETPDVPSTLYPGFPVLPTQPGLPLANISPAPNGREHIFDTYATWNATPKLTFRGEADYVINRTFAESAPGHTAIGAAYFKYSFSPAWYVGARTEYFNDRSGLFSGTSQALKEVTLVANHQVAPGFLVRGEYRRDFSNRRFFLSDTAGALKHAQTTATLGLVYWWGTKQGSW